jgi:hypothetical protein
MHKIWVRPRLERGSPRPSVSYFRFDLSRISRLEELDLGLDAPARWRGNISGNGAMTIRPAPERGVHFDVEFTAAGDRWCYPRAEFARPQDFSSYDGIRFEFRCKADDDRTEVRLQLIEAGGAAYFTKEGWKARGEWTRAVCAFESLEWGSFSPPDPNGKLDTGAVRALLIGLNTPRSALWLEVRGVELVRLPEAEGDSGNR